MYMISSRESAEWLVANLGKHLELGSVLEQEYVHSLIYELPADTGKKTALARVLTQYLVTPQAGLLWFTLWGVWPSAENMALFDAYRQSLGETRPISDAPGHVFCASDKEQLECLLDLALYFFWDANIFDGAGSIAIKVSHDEYILVRARRPDDLQRLGDDLGRLGLRQLLRVPFGR